jgi:hypothetical protein
MPMWRRRKDIQNWGYCISVNNGPTWIFLEHLFLWKLDWIWQKKPLHATVPLRLEVQLRPFFYPSSTSLYTPPPLHPTGTRVCTLRVIVLKLINVKGSDPVKGARGGGMVGIQWLLNCSLEFRLDKAAHLVCMYDCTYIYVRISEVHSQG